MFFLLSGLRSEAKTPKLFPQTGLSDVYGRETGRKLHVKPGKIRTNCMLRNVKR